jgi:phosphatidylserine/phosphatidylglycerophosphate/cardiolipin synthase-like enzyme
MTSRQFLQSAADARNGVRELLQVIFAAELVAPSRCLWVVSPWLRDVPVLDNLAGGFVSLSPELPRSEVRLSRILGELLARGTQVVIATRPEPGNRQVLDALGGAGGSAEGSLRFVERGDLHAKGIVGDRYALTGSMNLTYSGVERLNEMLLFQTSLEHVEQLRVVFRKEYGGTA